MNANAAVQIVAPSDAQLTYIAGLCDERGVPFPAAIHSKAEASECIAAILRREYDPLRYAPLYDLSTVPF